MTDIRSVKLAGLACALGFSFLATSCTVKTSAKRDLSNVMQVSVPEQKMALYRDGRLIRKYPISTSKFGLGDQKGSYKTPLGTMEVAEKVGGDKPLGAVFKSRKWTGEVIKPDAPGRDPIVSRILWLKGTEKKNENAYSRCIYIHGTAAERDIGKPASYGCIRMKSKDVADLYRQVGEGAQVNVVRKRIPGKEMAADAVPVNGIQPIPLVEPEVPDIFKPVDPNNVQPVWNQAGNFSEPTGQQVLAQEGFSVAHMNLPELREIPVDSQ